MSPDFFLERMVRAFFGFPVPVLRCISCKKQEDAASPGARQKRSFVFGYFSLFLKHEAIGFHFTFSDIPLGAI